MLSGRLLPTAYRLLLVSPLLARLELERQPEPERQLELEPVSSLIPGSSPQSPNPNPKQQLNPPKSNNSPHRLSIMLSI